MRLQLKHKIIGSQIGLILLTTLLLGVSCHFIMLHFLSNDQKSDLEFIAKTKSDALQQEILKISAQLKSIANSKMVEVYSTKFQDLALSEYLANFRELFPVLSYVNADGAEEVKIVNGDISDQLIDRGEDVLFRRAMKTPNTVFLSSVERSPDTGSLALRLAIARRAYFGDRFVGLISATVPLARITKVVVDQKIGETGFCSVIDSDGTILAFPDPKKVLTRIYNDGKATEDRIPRANLLNPDYSKGYIFDKECLVAASPIEIDGQNWSVLAVLPYKEFRSALNLLRNSIVIVFLVVLLMGILISLRLAGGILKPIKNLRAAAVKMGEGRFDISIETQAKDEIGVLAKTFNEMASNLREKTVSLQEAQKRLHEQNFMLEEMVKERTAELMESNKKLHHEIETRQKVEAQYMEARKMEAIATLAGGIAHQFNNALSIINGYIELMQLESSQLGNIGQIIPPMRASVQRMIQLTDQLLAYARGGRYYAEPVSVSNLVNDTLLLINRNLNPSTAIELDLPGDMLNVEADVAQLQMVMHAILSNAAEAMEEAGRIRVIGRNEIIKEHHSKELSDIKPGRYVSITVQDNGTGMSEDTKRRIFEPFFTTKFQGRGLGMAAVYGIIKNHKGWISVDSQLGQGTRVRIILPASKLKEENPD